MRHAPNAYTLCVGLQQSSPLGLKALLDGMPYCPNSVQKAPPQPPTLTGGLMPPPEPMPCS